MNGINMKNAPAANISGLVIGTGLLEKRQIKPAKITADSWEINPTISGTETIFIFSAILFVPLHTAENFFASQQEHDFLKFIDSQKTRA